MSEEQKEYIKSKITNNKSNIINYEIPILLEKLGIEYIKSHKSNTFAIFDQLQKEYKDKELLKEKMKYLILALYEIGKLNNIKIKLENSHTYQYRYEIVLLFEDEVEDLLQPTNLTIYNPKLEKLLKENYIKI